jgi:hypothetical protein
MVEEQDLEWLLPMSKEGFHTKYVITIDIDWAPDHMIDFMANVLIESRVSATWFATHRSPAVDRLEEQPELFELGIHPNFLPGSSHGTSVEEVLKHMKGLFPDAISTRSHGVYHTGRLAALIAKDSTLNIDSTFFMPEAKEVQPCYHEIESGGFYKVPFVWADDYELGLQQPNWSVDRLLQGSGTRVFMFHPVHVWHNTPSLEVYRSLAAHDPASSKSVEGKSLRGPRELFSELVAIFSVHQQATTLRSALEDASILCEAQVVDSMKGPGL